MRRVLRLLRVADASRGLHRGRQIQRRTLRPALRDGSHRGNGGITVGIVARRQGRVALRRVGHCVGEWRDGEGFGGVRGVGTQHRRGNGLRLGF